MRLDGSEKRLQECLSALASIENSLASKKEGVAALAGSIRLRRRQLAKLGRATVAASQRRAVSRGLKDEQQRHAKQLQRLRDEHQRVSRTRASLRRESGRLQKEVTRLRRAVPVSTLNHFDMLVRSGRDPIIAPVSQGYCSGCCLRLPAQLECDIRRSRNVKPCPSCQRLLFSTGSEGAVTAA